MPDREPDRGDYGLYPKLSPILLDSERIVTQVVLN